MSGACFFFWWKIFQIDALGEIANFRSFHDYNFSDYEYFMVADVFGVKECPK